MNMKGKGTKTERDLVHLFWATGSWVAHRIAGSGSSKYPSPDVIASNNLRKLAIEVKTTGNSAVYIPKADIEALQQFGTMFGAEPWIAVKFDRDQIYFLSLEDLKETPTNFCANKEIAKMKGLLFEEFVR